MAEEEREQEAEETPEAEVSSEQEGEQSPAGGEPQAAAGETQPADPKERRRQARASRAASVPAREARTSEERHAERVAERRHEAEIRRIQRRRAREKLKATKGAAEPTPSRDEQRSGSQKTRQGVVVSDRPDKTITVRIDVTRRHRRYEKTVRASGTLHAHDERNDAHLGDTVIVRESRPLSKTKRWRLVEILERAR